MQGNVKAVRGVFHWFTNQGVSHFVLSQIRTDDKERAHADQMGAFAINDNGEFTALWLERMAIFLELSHRKGLITRSDYIPTEIRQASTRKLRKRKKLLELTLSFALKRFYG